MIFQEAIARLRAHEEFRVVMEEAEKHRPTLMPMNPDKDMDLQAGKVMYQSGEQSGFDLLMTFLRGKYEPRS